MKIPSPDRYQTLLLTVIFSAILYILLIGNNSLVSRCNIQNKIKNTVTDINRIKEENRILSEEIERLKNDDEYLASIAHRLGYIRQNEKVYRFITYKSNAGTEIAPKPSPFFTFLDTNSKFIIISSILLTFLFIIFLVYNHLRRKKPVKIDKP